MSHTITIQAPAVMDQKIELTGDAVGSFLVHRATNLIFMDNDFRLPWSVTHIASGMRFPWHFRTRVAARGFAKDVEPLADWAAVKVAMRADEPLNVKGKWIAGEPTQDQIKAIYAAAETRGAVDT